ncbi:MAG TPA: amino acid adenylation domain-containing protein [Thermoanaerobaculia bacterium]|nr:amino acid adenylation domain-containing protein [Thermoanaerobaculia bacterium]
MDLSSSFQAGLEGRDAGAARTLPQILRLRARRDPGDRIYTFLLEGEAEAGHLTAADLDRQAGAVAAALRRTCAPGDRALLLFPPGLEFIAAFLGCLYAGVVAVPAYPPRPRRDRQRLETIVRDCAPRAVLTTGALRAATAPLAAEVPGLAAASFLATDELAAGGAQGDDLSEVDPAWPAFLQYTSGSTSSPKGVIVTHAHLMHNERMIRAAFRQDEGSVVVGWLPLYHDMGLIGNVLQPLFCGGRCVLMSPVAFLQRPRRWLEAIDRFRATTSGGPNFAYELCVEKVGPEERHGLDLSSWRVAYNGAEPVRAETLARFAEAFAPCGFRREAFYPCYGLAEATLFAAGPRRVAEPQVRAFDAAALAQHQAVPAADGRPLVACGEPWEGQRIAIADPETGAELPAGRVGEVWLSGPSVAAGYWAREEETARTFSAFLTAADGSAAGPFLRTGDLGFVAGGELFITGRIKDLVILRGRNHYPQDLELTAEQSHPELRPGSVAAFSIDGEDGERLVVVGEVERHFKAGVEAVAAAVRRAIAEEHEVQVHEVVLIRTGTLPKTSSGKIQRHLCRSRHLAGELAVVGASSLARPAAGESAGGPVPAPSREALLALPAVARREALLVSLAALASRRLRPGAAQIDPGQPLTEAGLDSLAAIELAGAAEAAWGIPVELAGLLAGGSLQDLADRILEQLADGPPEAAPARAAGPEPGGLSAGQQGLWFLHRLAPDSAAYNIAGAARLLGAVDPEALRRAFQRLLDRHAALRTTFAATAEGPVPRVHEGVEVAFVHEDASGWSAGELRRRLHDEAFRPFDLARGPLLRVALFRGGPDGEEAGWLVLAVHHIVADFWSLAVAARELAAFYAEASAGAWLEPAAPGARYSDYARWQEDELAGPRGERLWQYWQAQLAGAPRLELPTDRPRPLAEVHAGAARLLRWGPEKLAAVRGLARRSAATPFMVLLAGFQALLARYSGQRDFLVGSPTSGRAGSAGRFAGLVGYCVNPVALRADLSGDPAAGEWLERVRWTALAAFAHQDLPFARLAERLEPGREAGRPPLFQTMLSLEKAPQGEAGGPGLDGLAAFSLQLGGVRLALGALELESVALEVPAVQLDLTLLAAELPEGLAAALHFKTDLFEAATAERMLAHYGNLLSAMAGDPARRVGDLDLLAPEERRQLLAGWNRTRTGYPREATVHELFEDWAEKAPDRIALVDPHGGITLSYGALNRRADRLARELRARGVGPETLVGVALPRSAALIEATLAVLKAGGAYVPLDPASPAKRLLELVREVSLPLVLTESRWLPGLPAELPALCLDRLGEAAEEGGPAPPRATAGPESLAYAMFTSGSTGAPKAVGVAHRSVVRLVRGTGYIDFGPGQVFLQLAPAAFDAATLEIWGPLANGGRLVLFPPRTPSFAELGEVLAGQGVTTLWLTAGLFHEVVEHRLDVLRPVSQLLAGGDVLSARHVNRVLAELPGCRLFNGYGPTENTTFTCVHAVREPVPSGGSVPIGRPIANTRVYVLDESLAPAPVGAAGELCIGGDGLARGYLRGPERTAERFVPCPFAGDLAEEAGARLYRTGDRVRRLADGTIEFLGRIDRQTKIRGFRVEPGEVEAALCAHEAVRGAAVLVYADPAAGPWARRLVAFVVADPAAAPAAGLRGFLEQRLPAPMVPSAFVHLKALPLTANGKVDRRTLSLWAPAGSEDGLAAYAAPRTPLEELLAGIWADVLRVERVGIDDDFFARGGHSLLATRLLARVEGALGVDLPLSTLFEAPTVAALAGRVAKLGGAEPLPPLTAFPRREPLPLSFAQQRLWFLDRIEPESAAYNVPGALRLSGPLRADALEAAVREVVRRHESLRTGFPGESGEPCQVIAPEARIDLARIDLSSLPEPARSAQAAAALKAEAGRPFDLSRPPLLRAALLRLAFEEHVLLVTMHHIVSDGLSLQVLTRELAALYAAAVAGRPSPLPPPPQYADFALWQRGVLTGGRMERLLAYWRERLAGTPVLHLPTDRPRPAVASPRGGSRRIEIPAERTARLRAASRSLGVTPFMTLLGGFAALFARYSGQEDFALGSPVATRGRMETEGMVGLLVNTLVLRADLAGDPSAGDLLRRLRETVLGAHAHQDLPFERLVEELQPERGLDRTPLFQVMVAFFSAADEETAGFPGLRTEPFEVDNGAAKFDLTALLREERQRLGLTLVYRRDLFEAATIDRLAVHCVRLLEGIVADPGARISALPLLTEAEVHQLAGEWNPPPVEVPRDVTVHALFGQQARRTPDRPAVVFGDEQVNYAELARRAEALAGTLRRLGVGPEVLVGLCAERSVEAIVGILGVLTAGGAYLPLDPEHPRERLAFLLEDSRAKVLLTQERLLSRLEPGDARVVLLDRLPEADAAEEARAVSPAGAENAAYVIYTSGSTGRPKGTLIEHRSVVNLAYALRGAVYGDRPEPLRVGVNASLAFDASVKQVIQLLSGHTLHIVPEEVRRDGEELLAYLRERPLDVLDCTPSQLDLMLASGLLEREGSSPTLVLVGGEAIGETLWRRLAENRRTLFWNVYGPTECTVDTTACAIGAGADRPTLGRPLANVRVRLLDARLEAVPAGVPGELCIAGAGVARGYLNRPGLTAGKFVPDPASPEPGARMYRTGDLARYRPDGRIDFLGRADHQVKVRGLRIELGEIEARLELHPGIDRAVAVLREDAPGHRHLAAYFTGGESLTDAELRLWLRQDLPDSMVPAAFVRLEAFPLSAHGKVDRGRLPAPRAALERELVAPRTPLEESLARIWGELLRLDRVGIRDNFFELGGHSLLALQLAARIRQAVGVEIPVRALFEHPTIEELAPVLERTVPPEPATPEPVLRAGRRGGGRDLGQLLTEVSRLSPEEVRRRLAERDRLEGRS